MSAYLIEVDDTKQGVCYPTVIGPFADEEEARRFAEVTALGTAAQGGQGGYSAAHIVSDDWCDFTPERYIEDYIKSHADHLAEDSAFLAAALRVTGPGFEAAPFDEDLAIFEETCRLLIEHGDGMTAKEFDELCRSKVDAPALIVGPFLRKFQESEADA